MPFCDGGSYSNLPFGRYTAEIAKRIGCHENEVDSFMLTEPQFKSSRFMSQGLRTGQVTFGGGELVFRIPGANGKLISNLEVEYVLNYFPTTVAQRHGEIRTRLSEPDLLASIDVSQSGTRIGVGN